MAAQSEPRQNANDADCHRFVLDDGSVVTAHRHRNPDGSEGGWIASDATVDPTAIVRSNGFVWPKAVVGPQQVVEGHCFPSGQP